MAGAPDDEKTDFITDYIFQGGTWGTTQSVTISSAAKRLGAMKTPKHIRFKNIWLQIFPKVTYMTPRYPILQKMPFLLPVFWPIRWVTAVLFRRNNIAKCYQNTQVATPDRIQDFRQALQYVGLDFRN